MTDFEKVLLPFQELEMINIADDIPSSRNREDNLYSKYEKNNFNTFDTTEHKTYEIEMYLDPENNFYNNLNNNCEYYTDDQFKTLKMEGNFSVIHFNSRSLNKNFTHIRDYLSQFKPFSVVAVSETWLDHDKTLGIEMDGYELFTSHRTNRTGGGVALYIDKLLQCKLVNTNNVDNILESITVEIIFKRAKNIVLTCIYRTPGSCADTFTSILDNMFVNTNNKMHLTIGDFNIDILKSHENTKTSNFISTMFTNNQFPAITKPSRITLETATLIDNIYTNAIEKQTTAGLLINDITDHLPIFAIFHHKCNNERTPTSNTYTLTRLRTPDAINALRDDLQKQTWNEVYSAADPNVAYNAFLSVLTVLYDRHCPFKKISCKNQQMHVKPWMTKGIKNACSKKNLLYKTFLIDRNEESETRYKKYKNKLTNIIRKSKKDYYYKILDQHKSNIQGTWKILNSIIKKGTSNINLPNHINKNNTIIDRPKEIADAFNDFFVNVGPNLAKKIVEPNDKHGLDEKVINMNPHSIFINSVDEHEILTIVNNLKNKKSTDHTNIDIILIKSIIETILKPFTYICNLSLQAGIFPDEMKIAKVIPIYKNGDKQLLNNYRPISLLPQFSKILEKLFMDRLDSFINKHHLLNKHQYGFRPKRSTSMAVIELIDSISNATDSSEFTVGVFIDLSKAFDTIHHATLLKKLYRYGIRGTAYTWLKSYLTNRKQYVHLNGANSDIQMVSYGVPQGSVLGPKLFILFINDICDVLQNVNCVLFADDTSLYASGPELEQLLNAVENDLKILKKWFDINQLSLNINKTNFILFGNKKIKIPIKLSIDDRAIEQVNQTKFLGVIIDDKLNWKAHIDNLKRKISKTIAILHKVKYSVNKKSLHTLYCSLLLPYLTYCVEVWGHTFKSIIHSVFILQKKAIRIINHCDYLIPTNSLFIKSRLLKLEDLTNLNTAVIMYKAYHNILPDCMQELFIQRETKYNLRGTAIFNKIKVRTNTKGKCTTVKGVNLWNTLDNELKTANSIHIFKKLYKTRVIDKYTAL